MGKGVMLTAVGCIVLGLLTHHVSGIIDKLVMKDCMPQVKEWGFIEGLTIVPWPPILPGNITVSASVHLARAFTGNVRAHVEIRRKLGPFSIKLPCMNNVGTCNYTDVCGMLASMEGNLATLGATVDHTDQGGETYTTTATTVTYTTGTRTSTTEMLTTTTDNNLYSATVTPPEMSTTTSPLDMTATPEMSATPEWTTTTIPLDMTATSEMTTTTPETTTPTPATPDFTITPETTTIEMTTTTTPMPDSTTTSAGPTTPGHTTHPHTTHPDPIAGRRQVTDVTEVPQTTEEPSSCPAILVQNNIPCHCPFNAGIYVIPPTEVRLPEVGGLLGALAMGDYDVKIQFYDDDTGEEIMCQTTQISIDIPHAPHTTHGPWGVTTTTPVWAHPIG